MGFLKKWFGSGEKKQTTEYVDKDGIYFYFECANCGTRVKVRAHKQNDFLSEGNGYVWHKTIVDNKCFRRMQTVVYLDVQHRVTSYEMEGGKFLTQAEYEAAEQAAAAERAAAAQVDETVGEDGEGIGDGR